MRMTLQSIVVAVAVVMCAAATGTAQANGPYCPPVVVKHRPGYSVHNYHLTYGTHFSHGYYFRGGYYRHFSYRVWNSRYGCYFYYYPGTSCYYYWSGTTNCYYPITYVTVVAPNGPPPAGIQELPLQSPPVPPQSFQPGPNGQVPPQSFQPGPNGQVIPPQSLPTGA